MKKIEWKRKIKKQMTVIGTYQKEYDPVIETLSDILERRDETYEEFLQSGGEAVTEFISDRGAVNMKKNPRLAVWMDLNTQALTYWRDLGLTPAGLKKLSDAAGNRKEEGSALEKALNEISKELGKGT